VLGFVPQPNLELKSYRHNPANGINIHGKTYLWRIEFIERKIR